MKKCLFFGLLAIMLIFDGCDSGGMNNQDDNQDDNPPSLTREKAGLGMTYTFPELQVYDQSNITEEWNENIETLAIGNNLNAGSVTNGKLSVKLPELTNIPEDKNITMTSNPSNVRFCVFWGFDTWAGGTYGSGTRYRVRLRDYTKNYTIPWILAFADKEGVVQFKNANGETFDFHLVKGWNTACRSGSKEHYVTQKGIENALAYYDSVGE